MNRFSLFIFVLISCFFLFFAPAKAQSPLQTTIQVTSGTNDVNEDGTTFTNNATTLSLGNAASTTNSYEGLRFVAVNIPKNSTITTASLQVYSTQSQWISLALSIGADSVGNSTAFSSTSKPSGRTQTTQKVTSSTNVQWNANTWYTVANLSTIVQPIINRSDWQSGNSLSLLIKGTGSAWARKFMAAYELNTAQAAKLVITYTLPPTPTPTPTPVPTPTATPTPTPAPRYNLNGTVFVDSDGDGILDGSETGYANAFLAISGGWNSSTITSSTGTYAFTYLLSDTYTLTLTVPAGFRATTPQPLTQPLTTNAVSNIGIQLIPTPTPTPTATPSPTPTPTPIPVPTYTISGMVFTDANGNGILDTLETGYDGATVNVTGLASASATTTSNGLYSFTGLFVGAYSNTVTVPAGYQMTTANPVITVILADTTVNFGIQLIPTPTPTPTPEPTAPPTATPTPTPVPTSTPLPTPVPTPNQAAYYVSPDGSDSNTGAITTPFKTIQKAVSTTKTDSKPGAIIHVLPGTYRQAIAIDGVNGTEVSPVVIMAENGAGTVFVNGSESTMDTRLTWTQSTGSAQFTDAAAPHIYAADVSVWNATPELAFDTSSASATRLPKAREPDWNVTTEWKYHENWWKAEGADGSTQNTLIDGLDDVADSYPEASASAGNLKSINGFTTNFLVGSRIFLKDGIDGHDAFSAVVTDHDATNSGKITFDKNLVHFSGNPAVGQYTKYYLEGESQLLDTPGEWYYDQVAKKLYIWPIQETSPGSLPLEFALRPTVFSIHNSSYVTLKDMNVQYANYAYGLSTGPDGAIRFFGFSPDQTHHITLDNLDINHNGIGLRLYQSNTTASDSGSLHDVTLKNSKVMYSDGYALVSWHAPTPNSNALIHNLAFINNEFSYMGFRGSGDGIFMQHPEKVLFINNYLHHSAHNAIEIQQGKGSGNSLMLVENNLSENNCYNGSDCGAFKFWDFTGGTGSHQIIVTHNIFRGTKGWSYASQAQNKSNSLLGFGYNGSGYYSDGVVATASAQDCAVSIFRNLIYDNSASGAQYTNSRDQCAFNNVFSQNDIGIRMNNFTPLVDGSFLNKIRGNIILSTEPSSNPTSAKIFGISSRINKADENQLQVDGNVYQLSGPNAYDMYKQDVGFTNIGTWKTTNLIRANTPWEILSVDTTTASSSATNESQFDITAIEQTAGISQVDVPPEIQGAISALEQEFGITIPNASAVGRLSL
ncbi:MAG: SdrD B-like domain-containing protein [Candidatus Woesebacteria bacterium]